MADDSSETIPRIKVSSAYPGAWYIVEVDGGEGKLHMELRRPVGEEDSDVFHLDVRAPLQPFEVQSTTSGGVKHTHERVESAHLSFSGPRTVWPDFVRCLQALASVFDTLETSPLDREKVREHFFKKK